ncbi:MAG: hypothetical protein Kilf2KO_29500 [Rhodospirillales bacterium]
MKFSANRLYVERYVKCLNCGILIYENDQEQLKDDAGRQFCGTWCQNWDAKRHSAE